MSSDVMCEATNNLSIEELDVRSLDLAQRHEKICERIDDWGLVATHLAFAPGKRIQLV